MKEHIPEYFNDKRLQVLSTKHPTLLVRQMASEIIRLRKTINKE